MVVRDVVVVDRKRAAGSHLVVGAQVDDGANTQPDHGSGIVRSQAVQAVGAKEGPPAGRPSVAGRVAAEVAEVVHREQRDHSAIVVDEGRNIDAGHHLYGTHHPLVGLLSR